MRTISTLHSNNTESDICEIPMFASSDQIPRVVHQVYVATIPQRIKDLMDSLKAKNPMFEFRFYDEKAMISYIKEKYGEKILSYFLRINPAYPSARCDLFRYLVIYAEGGIYLDVKSTSSRPLDQILVGTNSYLLCRWDNRKGEAHENFGRHTEVASMKGGELQQWHVISAPGHPFLRRVINNVLSNIDRYRPWSEGTGQKGVMRLTGPTVYTLTIAKMLRKYPHTYFRTHLQAGLVYSGGIRLSTLNYSEVLTGGELIPLSFSTVAY